MDRLEGPDFEKLICTARQIWIRRNNLVFEREFTHPKIVAQVTVEQLDFHVKVNQRAKTGERGKCTQDEKWTAPWLGYVKINWDVAFDQKKKLMGVGVVVRDCKEGVITSQCSTRPYINDPTVAEAIAL